MAKITQLPKATAVTDSDIAVIVQDGETRQIPRTLLAPHVTVDAEMSEISENPVQNKAITAAIQELETGIIVKTPTDLKLENNQLQLIAGNTAIGNSVEIKKMPTLLDTFTIADGGEPVEFYQLSLTNQNWRKILISGTVQSTDTDAVNRKLTIGTNSGFVYLNFQNTFNRKKYFTIDAECMANGSFRAHCTLSLYQYTDSNGGTYENVGRNPTTPATRIPTVYMRILESQFAPGTSFEVWGVE